MKKLNIFSGECDNEIKDLRKSLINKDITNFKYKEWLQSFLHNLLNYDSEGSERPELEREDLFNALIDIYPYEGSAYHGFMDKGNAEDVVSGMKTIVSYSKDINIAYEFATSSDDLNNSILVSSIKSGFDFGNFLEDVKDYLSEDDKIYLREKEVWGYIGKDNSNIIDCTNLSLDSLKKALGVM